MPLETVVFLGNLTNEQVDVAPLVSEFDWSIENAPTLDGLADICSRHDVVAVLVDPAVLELPWDRAISAVREVAPRALPILCHRFSNTIDWTEASAAGAFHLLGLPLNLGELRQSLGFVWAKNNNRFHVVSMTEDERPRLRSASAGGGRGSGTTANVA